MKKNRKEIQVEWGDCDPAGIVYYPRFFEMFDSCTNALFESVGFKKQEVLKTLPKGQLTLIAWKGKNYYVQPDSTNPNVAWVGTPAEFQTYQQLRLAKQLSNDNLMAAQMNQDAMYRWGGAWGPGFYGGFGRWR